MNQLPGTWEPEKLSTPPPHPHLTPKINLTTKTAVYQTVIVYLLVLGKKLDFDS